MTKGSGRIARSRAAEMAREQQRRSRITALIVTGVVVAISVIALIVVFGGSGNKPGVYMPNLGNIHIENGSLFENYSTSPPTSGPHWGNLTDWGVSDEPIRNELQTHNLEDGGVGVQYNCPDGCPQLVAQLEQIVSQFSERVFMAPYPDMEHRIALTAWTRIDAFEVFDRGRILDFIDEYRGIDHHLRY